MAEEVPRDAVHSDRCQSCGNIVPLVKPGEDPNKYATSHNSWCEAVVISFCASPVASGGASLHGVDISGRRGAKRGFAEQEAHGLESFEGNRVASKFLQQLYSCAKPISLLDRL